MSRRRPRFYYEDFSAPHIVWEIPPSQWLEETVPKSKTINSTQPLHVHTLPWTPGEIDATCVVCLQPLLLGKQLPCHHTLHLRCLMKCLKQKQACPICRADYETRQSLLAPIPDTQRR